MRGRREEYLLETVKNIIRRSETAERFGRLLLDKRYQLARRHLRGVGLEIGALDRPLWLPTGATAYYLDRLPPRDLYRHYPELSHRKFYVSLVADGESMDCIADGSLDFITANHVIEHCEDPIATLKTFTRKLKTGGKVFMAVPDMRRTFDRQRTETTWEHLSADHAGGPQHSREEHYREWVERVENMTGEAAAQRAQELRTMKYSIHFHCWTRAGFEAFLHHLQTTVPLRISDARSWRNENIFILQKSDDRPARTDV